MDPPPSAPHLWDRMADYLRGIASSIGSRPKALLVISGHWETTRPTVNSSPHPPLLFDYYGFPEHTYRLTYPAPGSPQLAARVRELFSAAGIDSAEDPSRGLDHGVFVPFKLIYPDADVPLVQLSLERNLDPARHVAIGRALEPLRDEGVLIVGSGMSYHNLRELMIDRPQFNKPAEEFDRWLAAAVTDADPAGRNRKLIEWESAPGARASHPDSEHLLPLMVAAGAAGDDRGRQSYSDVLFGKALSGFQFG
jgi:aromatic ring-opening dioxygenase catalytic subunit (LigB family)